MRKFLFLIPLSAFLFVSPSVSGQECEIYKDYKEGSSTKMVHYDHKDKVTGFTTTTVKEKKNLPGGVSLVFHQVYDNNDDYTFESEFSMECVNGEVKVDMGKLVDPTSMTAYQDMEFDIVADDMSIPSGASPGDKLNDGSVTVSVQTGTPIKVSITVTMSNRMVESRETVETPAGKFDCLKISYDLLTQIGFVKVSARSVEFYNKEHGVIRSESFNKKGKLTGYSVVEEINY